jgi:hypothetical protein
MYPDIAIMIGIIYIAYRLKYGAPTELVDDAPDDPRYGERDLDL